MERLINRERSGRHKDGIAVGHRTGDAFGGDVTARPTAILDHHRLPKSFGELLGHDPAYAIGNSTGGESNHRRDITVRIGLSVDRLGRQYGKRKRHYQGISQYLTSRHQFPPMLSQPQIGVFHRHAKLTRTHTTRLSLALAIRDGHFTSARRFSAY